MKKRLLLPVMAAFSALTMAAAQPLLAPKAEEPTPAACFDLSKVANQKEAKAPSVARVISRADEAADESIYEVPEGEVITAQVSAQGYSYHWRGPVGSAYNGAGEYVICENGDVYIKSPITFIDTHAYLKGTIQGDKVVVNLPQALGYIEDWEGTKFPVYANMMKYKITDPEYNVGWFYNVENAEEDVLEYAYDPETMTMSFDFTGDVNEGALILGLVYDTESQENDAWTYYGLRSQKLSPFTDVANVLPEGIELEQWALVTRGLGGDFVQCGIMDNVFYVSYPLFGEEGRVIVKGDIEGDKIVFADHQYLGLESGNFVYTINSKVFWGPGYVDYFTMTDEPLVCEYDAEQHLVTAADGDALVFNYGTERYLWLSAFADFSFRIQTPEMQNSNPVNPVMYGYQPSIYYDESYTSPAYLIMGFPNLSTEGYVLDTKDMFWEMYVNDELYTFEPDKYTYLPEAMTQVPMSYTDWDIWANGTMRTIYLYMEDYEVISFISYNNGPDGRTYESGECIISFGQTGIEEVKNVTEDKFQAQPMEVFFTNMVGQRVANPEKGLYIKSTVYSDGTIRSEKVLKK